MNREQSNHKVGIECEHLARVVMMALRQEPRRQDLAVESQLST